MIDSIGSCLRHVAVAACLTAGFASSAAAQVAPPPLAEAPPGPQFMSRYDFHLSADAFASEDERFKWRARFGGDFDLVDYVRGRATFLVDLENILGSERRPFDPNQANYTLEAATSARTRHAEIFFVFHHISRHFADRPKIVAIAWNVAEARALRRLTIKGTTIDLRADVGKIAAHAFVDYAWIADADVLLRRHVSPRVDAYARAYVETFGINPRLSSRARQTGGRVEGGLRLPGAGGAVELFAGYEHVVDADANQRVPFGWAFAGFRLVTK